MALKAQGLTAIRLAPGEREGMAAALAKAGLRRCRAIYLLTISGAAFFERLGYAACDRADVPPAVRASQQFAVLCPASAAVMVKRLA